MNVLHIVCPKCEGEFTVNVGMEKVDLPAVCPFCTNRFRVTEAKRILRPPSTLTMK